VLLGDRGSRCRCLFVWASGTSTVVGLVLVLRPEPGPARDVREPFDTLPLDQALADLAAVVLVACAAWGWLALTATVVEAWRGVSPARRRPWHPPAGVRRALLTACGVALTTTAAAPALATDAGQAHHASHHPRARLGAALLDGLPLPERAVAPSGSPARPAPASRAPRPRVPVRRVLVKPGDCLWSIAALDLGPGASESAIDARWRAIYAANHTLIGPDPGLVEPGQRLRIPAPRLPATEHSGKDAS